MTPPPTSIDGTDITGATIDGQDVQEITIDGQTVFTAAVGPPSEQNRWPIKENSFPLENTVGTADLKAINGPPSLVNDSTAIENVRMDTSATDGAEASAASNPGAMSWAVTIDFSSNITNIQRVFGWGEPTTAGDRVMRFRGDIETNRLSLAVTNDSSSFQSINAVVGPGQHRVAGVLDPANSEFRLGVDGSFVAFGNASGSFQTTLQDVVVAFLPGRNRGFVGSIDEPRHDGRAWDLGLLQDDFNRQPWS
jgi:hypothetical protein